MPGATAIQYKAGRERHVKARSQGLQPVNGSPEDVWEGFSWPCSFLGCFWFFYKNLWGWTAISFVVSIATSGLAWFIFPFIANEQHAKSLKAKGYLSEDQWRQKQGYTHAGLSTERGHSASSQSVPIADELSKLADLKN